MGGIRWGQRACGYMWAVGTDSGFRPLQRLFPSGEGCPHVKERSSGRAGEGTLSVMGTGRLAIPSPVYQFPSCGPLRVQVGLIQPGTPSRHGVCILNLDFLSSRFLTALPCSLCAIHTELFSVLTCFYVREAGIGV